MGHQESITGGLLWSELSDDSVGFLQSHNTETMQYVWVNIEPPWTSNKCKLLQHMFEKHYHRDVDSNCCCSFSNTVEKRCLWFMTFPRLIDAFKTVENWPRLFMFVFYPRWCVHWRKSIGFPTYMFRSIKEKYAISKTPHLQFEKNKNWW